MAPLTWDAVGERLYEVGVDHGVLYIPDAGGVYADGVAWNGLTTVTESPSGAEPSPQYADNIKYLNLISVEEFGGTIEAFTYPEEFAQFDGTVSPAVGVTVGQQARKYFGLSYRSQIGNDVEGSDLGYKLHLVYGCMASPSEKAYATINDSPEAIAFSWEFYTVPVAVAGLKPTSLIVIDSTKVDPADLALLEAELYGDAGGDPNLPMPDAVIAFFSGAVTTVDTGASANQPTYNSGTHVVTLPTVTGIQWKVNGVNKAPGAQPALTVGQTAVVTANALPGYTIDGDDDWVFDY